MHLPPCTWQWILLSHNVKRSLTLLFILLYLIEWNGRGFSHSKKMSWDRKRSGWSLKMCWVKLAQKKEKWTLRIHFFQLIFFFVRYLNEVDDSLNTWLSENCGIAYQNILVHAPKGVINASLRAMESDCFT